MIDEYVAGFLFAQDTKGRPVVTLIQKTKPEWQAGKWNGVGGKVEPNEYPHDAMAREFAEETGLAIEEWEKFAGLAGHKWRVTFYRAFESQEVQNDVQTMEEEEVKNWSVDMLPDVIPNLRWLIPLALDTNTKYYPINIGVVEPGTQLLRPVLRGGGEVDVADAQSASEYRIETDELSVTD